MPAVLEQSLAGAWNWAKRRPLSVLLALLLCCVYAHFLGCRAVLRVDLTLDTPRASLLQIYWASGTDNYSEQNMRAIYLKPGRKRHSVFLTSLGAVERLRFDPLRYPGQVTLHRFSLRQAGFAPIELAGPGLEAMTPLTDAETRGAGASGMTVLTTSADGQLELALAPRRTAWFPLSLSLIHI